jgi:hypothetical protein
MRFPRDYSMIAVASVDGAALGFFKSKTVGIESANTIAQNWNT